MGNTDSNVTSGIKEQAGTSTQKVYTLLNLKGGGTLVNLLKEASKNRALTQHLDEKIKTLVEPFLYNNGEGMDIPISELVLRRNRERPKHKQIAQNKVAAPSPAPAQDALKATSETDVKTNSVLTLNGSTYSNKKEKIKTRLVCWKLEELGGVGEGIIHTCFLISSAVHLELAKRLVKIFPKMVNDIYMCDEYYGENALHMAIVNEDPAMVKFLLDNGADYHERCIGNFFCPEDLKASRTDKLDHEWFDHSIKTNYEGYVYWGEYPLGFAACLGQEECYRLILAKGADPDRQDTHGNTVLHMLVIHEKLDMFNMVYELGASIDIANRQGLTVLTIAAKLARKEMFFHILKLQREIYWQLGSITCAAYPLEEIDTINTLTGEINKASALNLVVYGERMGHLDMMDGLLVDLLYAKWNTFIKFRFYRKFAMFACYFLLTVICFVGRPEPLVPRTVNATDLNMTECSNCSMDNEYDACYLQKYEGDMFRMVVELICIIGAFLYLLDAAQEARFLGYQTFLENLATVPSRVLFLISCLMMMLLIPLRLSCACKTEDVVAVCIMLSTSPYFLFFCRGFKMVGPFVVMIYKMILTDLLCFVTIYLVFVMGFSQAYYVIFLSHDNHNQDENLNFFGNPMESIMALFVMSLTEFGDIYKQFDNTAHPTIAKILFIMYMALVAILLINMLIAMMGKTYQDIAERKNEWIRQWARIVLVVERGVSPKECLAQLVRYSKPMSDGRKALIVRLKHNEEEKEELRVLGELKTTHIDNKRRQQSGSNILSPRSTPRKTISSTSL